MNMFIYRKEFINNIKIILYYIIYLQHECNLDRQSQWVCHLAAPESHTYVSSLLQENQRNTLLLHKMASAYKLISAIRIKCLHKKMEIIMLEPE